MPRRKVEFVPGECYHVYNRGVDRQPIFFDRDNYTFFLRRIREYLLGEERQSRAVAARGSDVLAYCLMPNHFHLLVRLLADDFPRRMQSLAQSYTNAVNRRMSRVGPLFQGRFQAKHVDAEAYLLHLSRYIHLNPVEGGLAMDPRDWEFSSYADYVGSRKGTLPMCDSILSVFGTRDRYREFVLEGCGKRDARIAHLLFEE